MIKMSWRPVEMQVALPRIQDAGKIQEQLQTRNQHLQESIAQSQIKTDLEKRKKVNENEQKDHVGIKEKEREMIAFSQLQKKKNEEFNQNINHPFLGKQIDFNG